MFIHTKEVDGDVMINASQLKECMGEEADKLIRTISKLDTIKADPDVKKLIMHMASQMTAFREIEDLITKLELQAEKE